MSLVACCLHLYFEPSAGLLNCKQVSNSNRQLAVFPQLQSINITAHKAVGSRLGDEKILTSLIQKHISLNASLKAISLDFLGDFACLIQESPATIGVDSINVLRKDITALSMPFGMIASDISYLRKTYLEIAPAYHSLRSSAADSAEVITPSDFQKFVFIVLPFTKQISEPWQNRNKLYQEADRGIKVLHEELVRSEEVRSVYGRIQANLDRKLRDWKDNLPHNGIPFSRVWPSGQTHAIENWFRQDVGFPLIQGDTARKNEQLDMWWTELGCECEASH